MKLPTWAAFGLLFLVTTIVTLIARVPLSLALAIANPPLKAERISGTIWHGKIDNAWVSGYPLGTVRVSADFLPLLTGSIAGHIQADGGFIEGDSKFRVGQNRVRFSNGRLQAHLEKLGQDTTFETPLKGRVDVQLTDVDMVNGVCQAADMTVATDALQQAVRSFDLQGMMLQGSGRCEDGALVLPLSGESVDGRADISLRVSSAGYQTELVLVPASANVGEFLHDFGFQKTGNSYSLIQRGDLPQ